MKQTKKKKNAKSILHKLLFYFLGLSAIILLILWFTQTVFLDDIYRMITTARVKADTEYIASHIDDDDIVATLDKLHDDNNMIIEVYNASTMFFNRLYSSEEDWKVGMFLRPHELYSYYTQASENGGKFFENNKTPVEQNGELSTVYYTEQANSQHLTSVRLVKSDDKEVMIILRAPITPVESTVTTIRFLLIIITVLVVILSAFLAILASKNIAKPLQDTTKKAKRLGKQDYEVSFDSKGYKEVEELNATLNYASAELAVADGLRKELIANVSHDLRTPLTMITGYAEVMKDIPGENTEENLQAIIDESQRLTNLVNDLLDISKLQSGAIPVEKHEFSITSCINSIISRFTIVCQKQGYIINFEPTEEAFVFADEARISQVVYNLISNAVNYSSKRKEITIKQTVTSNTVRIDIVDSGDGIEPEKLQNIWDRYYRVDKTHHRAVMGTGLGLSIVKEILDMHNSHFGVTSTLGVGSDFWFELETAKDNNI